MKQQMHLLALLISTTVLLTACGGSGAGDSTPQLATLETQAPTEQAADAAVTIAPTSAAPSDEDAPTDEADAADPVEEADVTFEDAALEFAECMRNSGFPQWPDPEAGVRAVDLLQTDIAALGIDQDDPDFQDALTDCRSVFDGVSAAQQEFTAEQQAAVQDALINIMACVREQPGFEEIPDPDFTAPGGLRAAFAVVFASGEYELAETLELIDSCREELGYPRLGEA